MKSYFFAISLSLLLSAQPIYPNDETFLLIKYGLYILYKLADCFSNRKYQEISQERDSLQKENEALEKKLADTKAEADKQAHPIVVKIDERKPTDLEKAAQAAVVAHVALESVDKVRKAGDAIYHYYYPTKEQKMREEEYELQTNMHRNARIKLNAQQSLRRCLAYNDDAPKDAEGLPRICAQQFKEFAAVATRKEVDEMKDDFRQR